MKAPDLTVVGIDAATATIVDPLLGDLPTLARLFAAGARGTLRSTMPPLTSQAWATAFTGVNAGEHGMWEFVERVGNGYRLRLTNGSFRRAPAVWDYLGAAGRRVGVVNVPFTWPAPRVNGFAVAGLDAADDVRGMTFPPELVGEAEQRFGRAEPDHRAPLTREGRIDLDLVRRSAEQRVRTTLWLAERFEPELLICVFMAADHALHYGWAEWEQRGAESALAEVYRILDGATGELLEGLGAESTLVLSDHGGGPLEGELNLNAWLAELGLLTYATGAGSTRSTARGALMRLAAQRRRLPEPIRYALRRRAPALRDRVRGLRDFDAIDWSRTRAFAYGSMGSVVVNLRGRDEQGAVDPAAYDAVAEEIVAAARELRSPAGEPVVAAVHRREALFHGPYVERLPDLIVEIADWRWQPRGDLRRRTPVFRDARGRGGAPFVGFHRAEGIVALAGPQANSGGRIAASLEDIAPTLLYLLGEEIPSNLEGRVLEEAIHPPLLDEKPPRYRAPEVIEIGAAHAYGAAETAQVAERLRGLGYLE